MARIAVRRDAFEQGTFPSVCCKTGAPADGVQSWEFSNTPSWTWILLLFGVFPFLIATAFATERFSGLLPLSSVAASRLTVARRLIWLFGGAAVLCFAVAFAAYDSLLPIALAFAVLCLIAIAVRWYLSPSANLDGRDVVILSNVHRGFVAAIHAIPAEPDAEPEPEPTDPGRTL
jgi:hypothetical protein